MKKIRVTYTLVVDITPVDEDIDQVQRAIDMVCDEPTAYIGADNVTCATELVEVGE